MIALSCFTQVKRDKHTDRAALGRDGGRKKRGRDLRLRPIGLRDRRET